MKIKLQLKENVSSLLKNEQQIKNVNNYLYEIILEWHNSDEKSHREVIYHVRVLKDFFEKLSSDKNDIVNHIECLNYLCSSYEIDDFSNSLHDAMMCYLKYSNEIGYKPLEEYFNNYKYLRNFLKELKIIEREINIKREVKVYN